MVGRAKWDAWKSASESYENNTHAAEQRYLAIARELGWVPRSTPVVGKTSEKRSEDGGDADGDVWDHSVDTKSPKSSGGGGGGGGGSGGMGTSVSSMVNPGPDLSEAQTLHGVAIAGDPEKLNEFLLVNPAADVNARDEFVRLSGTSVLQSLSSRDRVIPPCIWLVTEGACLLFRFY